MRTLFLRHNAFILIRCGGCGLVYLDPPPDGQVLADLYSDPYAGASEGYFRKAAKKTRRARIRMRRILRFLNGPPHGLRFLDAGCSGGFVAEAARLAGFEAWGIDPDAGAVAYARRHYPDIQVVHARLEDTMLSERSFDVVYCSEVIEHVPDCNRFVGALARLMRPGGIIYLTTPDLGHWRRPRDVTKWDAFCPPAHCLYFSLPTLARLLKSHGFKVLHRRWAWKPGIKLIARLGAPAPGVIAKPGAIA